MSKLDTAVLIVGGGPVGLFSALVLDELGVEVQVVEEQWGSASRSYALALHPESLRLLDELNLADELVKFGNPVRELLFYGDGEKKTSVSLSGLSGKFPFVLVLPQHHLEEVLRRELGRRKIPVLWNHRFVEIKETDGRIVTGVDRLTKESVGYSVSRTEWVVDRELELRSQFLIGADGHRSRVRRELGIDFEEKNPARNFAVFEFETGADAGTELQVVLNETDVNVLWPMPEGRFRWSFELADLKEGLDPRRKSRLFVQLRDEPFPHVTPEKLSEFIEERAPWFQEKVEEVVWSAAIQFENRLVPSFGRKRAWLVGDSAHLALPIGIQSMNIGFREAEDLASRIDSIVSGSGSLELLDAYDEMWQSEWARMLSLADKPQVRSDSDAWIDKKANWIPYCIPASGVDLKVILDRLGIDF